MPALVPDYVKQDILFAYRHPEKLQSDGDWIQWILNLRQPRRRFALEFVEGWSAPRILIAVAILLVASTAVGFGWTFGTADVQSAFTIASFVLGAGSRTYSRPLGNALNLQLTILGNSASGSLGFDK